MVDYLQAVLKDVVENADDFKKSDEEAPVMFMGMPVRPAQKGEGAFRKYRINVLVDNSGLTGRSGGHRDQPGPPEPGRARSSIRPSSAPCSPTST